MFWFRRVVGLATATAVVALVASAALAVTVGEALTALGGRILSGGP
jgi:phage baseplate assembly protein gpV